MKYYTALTAPGPAYYACLGTGHPYHPYHGCSISLALSSCSCLCSCVLSITPETTVLTRALRSMGKSGERNDIRSDGLAAWCCCGTSAWEGAAPFLASAEAATNPSTLAAPTAIHGYCCVHRRTSAATFTVSCISANVCWIATLASAACCCKKVASSRVLYRRICGPGGPVGDVMPKCGLLLELTFGILLHLLVAGLPLLHAHPDKRTESNDD
jgi:hypothetical protein